MIKLETRPPEILPRHHKLCFQTLNALLMRRWCAHLYVSPALPLPPFPPLPQPRSLVVVVSFTVQLTAGNADTASRTKRIPQRPPKRSTYPPAPSAQSCGWYRPTRPGCWPPSTASSACSSASPSACPNRPAPPDPARYTRPAPGSCSQRSFAPSSRAPRA